MPSEFVLETDLTTPMMAEPVEPPPLEEEESEVDEVMNNEWSLPPSPADEQFVWQDRFGSQYKFEDITAVTNLT